jgi:hypothetical protein
LTSNSKTYFFTEKIVKFFAHKLDGKKTLIGGIGMILMGLAGVIGCIWPDLGLLLPMDFDEAATMIVGGFSVLGVGGKLQKVIDGNGSSDG